VVSSVHISGSLCVIQISVILEHIRNQPMAF